MGLGSPGGGAAVAGVARRPLGAAATEDAAALQQRAQPEQEDREHDYRKGKEDYYECLKHPWLILPLADTWDSGFASTDMD